MPYATQKPCPKVSSAANMKLLDLMAISISFPIFQKSSTEKVMKASAGRHMYRVSSPRLQAAERKAMAEQAEVSVELVISKCSLW